MTEPISQAASAPAKLSQSEVVVAEWRQAWRPGLAALIEGSISYSLYPSISSLFVEPLEHQFGWTRGDIALVHSFGLIVAFAAPLIGWLTDRFGVRHILTLGLILFAGCYGLLALMRGSLAYYYIVYFFFSMVGFAASGVTFTRVLTGAFNHSRGTALAIARSGVALAGAVMPFILFPTIEHFGVAGGYLLLAGLQLFVALPLVRLWVPTRAEEVRGQGAIEPMQTWQYLLGVPKVRVLVFASMFNFAPVAALLSQMKPLAVSKGLDATLAVGAVSAIGIAAAAGALLSGILVDRFWAPAVAFTLNVLPAIGCLLLFSDQVPPSLFYGAVLLIGLGLGAEIDIVAFMIARYFGLGSYATIYGLSTLGIGLITAFGTPLIGWAYDAFGNYDAALVVSSVSFCVAALFYLAMGRYPLSITDKRRQERIRADP